MMGLLCARSYFLRTITLAALFLAAGSSARAQSDPPKDYTLELEMFTLESTPNLNKPVKDVVVVRSSLPTTGGRVSILIAVGVKKKPDGFDGELPTLTWTWTTLEAGDNFEKASMLVNHTTEAGPFSNCDSANTYFVKHTEINKTHPTSGLPGKIAGFTADFTVPGFYHVNTLVTAKGTDDKGNKFKGTLRCKLPVIYAVKVSPVIKVYLVPDMEGLSKVKILPEELKSKLTYKVYKPKIIASATATSEPDIVKIKAGPDYGAAVVDAQIKDITVASIPVKNMGLQFTQDKTVVLGYQEEKRKLSFYLMPSDDDTATRPSFTSDDTNVATVDPTMTTKGVYEYDRIGYVYVYAKNPGETNINGRLKVGPDLDALIKDKVIDIAKVFVVKAEFPAEPAFLRYLDATDKDAEAEVKIIPATAVDKLNILRKAMPGKHELIQLVLGDVATAPLAGGKIKMTFKKQQDGLPGETVVQAVIKATDVVVGSMRVFVVSVKFGPTPLFVVGPGDKELKSLPTDARVDVIPDIDKVKDALTHETGGKFTIAPKVGAVAVTTTATPDKGSFELITKLTWTNPAETHFKNKVFVGVVKLKEVLYDKNHALHKDEDQAKKIDPHWKDTLPKGPPVAYTGGKDVEVKHVLFESPDFALPADTSVKMNGAGPGNFKLIKTDDFTGASIKFETLKSKAIMSEEKKSKFAAEYTAWETAENAVPTKQADLDAKQKIMDDAQKLKTALTTVKGLIPPGNLAAHNAIDIQITAATTALTTATTNRDTAQTALTTAQTEVTTKQDALITKANTDLPNEVSGVDFEVKWKLAFGKGKSQAVGKNKHPMYLTWKDPKDTKVLYTFAKVSCEGADKVLGKAATADDWKVVNAIWTNRLATRNIVRATPITKDKGGAVMAAKDLRLTYYGFKSYSFSTTYAAADDGNYNSPNSGPAIGAGYCPYTTSFDLVSVGNGQCHSWADFMLRLLLTNGLDTIHGEGIFRLGIHPKASGVGKYWGLTVKNWDKQGAVALWKIKNKDLGVAPAANPAAPAAGDAVDNIGVPGQGTSPNPPSTFGSHWVVVIHKKEGADDVMLLYDPSYALTPLKSASRGEKDLRDMFRIYERAAMDGPLKSATEILDFPPVGGGPMPEVMFWYRRYPPTGLIAGPTVLARPS